VAALQSARMSQNLEQHKLEDKNPGAPNNHCSKPKVKKQH